MTNPMTILLLSVDGGEREQFIGAYRDRDALDVAMNEEAIGEDTGREEGYVFAEPAIDEEGREVICLHEEGEDPEYYTLCFFIRTTTV